MDSLCLKTGINGITPAIHVGGGIDVRANPSQVSAVGRSTADKSTTSQKQKTVFSRFAFKYPLKSLWAAGRGGGGGGGGAAYNGLAIDNAVLVENDEKRAGGGEGGVGESGAAAMEGQKDSWVLKILHVRSLWGKDQKMGGGLGAESGHEEKDGGVPLDDPRKVSNSNGEGDDDEDEDDEECAGCRVEDDDEKQEAEFDRDSFSRLLRRVSLAEARLYSQMSYLGNLAYCIPKIQVRNFHLRNKSYLLLVSVQC